MMKAIYEPKGAAREYSPLALNLYSGCSHGCTYCYAPSCLRRTREQFTKVIPRRGILQQLEKEITKEPPQETVLLSFTSDPYQPEERKHRLTRNALEIMDSKVKKVAILTKSRFVEDDFEIIKKNDWAVGITLSCFSDQFAKKYEPNATSPKDRLAMLKIAESIGIKTFISIEPVLSESEFKEILQKVSSTKCEEGIRIGKWNHSTEAKQIDWKSVLEKSIEFARSGHKVYIKDELAKFGSVPNHLRKRFFG